MVVRGITDMATSITEKPVTEAVTEAPKEGHGGGVQRRDGERKHDVEGRESRAHIPDFEEVLNEIDNAISNGPGSPKIKAAIPETTANQFERNLKLVDVEIMEENPGWRNNELERNGKQNDVNMETIMSDAEFKLGWVDLGFKGAISKGRPNKSGGKGKQKIRPNVIRERGDGDMSDKGEVGLKEAWNCSKVTVQVARAEGVSFLDVMWQLMMVDGGKDEVAARVVTIAWSLWHNRNEMRNGGVRKSGQRLVQWAMDYLAEYGAAMELTEVEKPVVCPAQK
nr:hypothetical protein CFP56_60065 [Quercus suber]